MTVNSLSCGHCPRDDFESVDELREHVRNCSHNSGGIRSGVTRDCPECGLVSNRLDLTITAEGQLVCPGCGEVITSYAVLRTGTDHLLLSDNEQRSGHAAHKPSEEHPLIPLCASKYRQTANDNYRPIPAANVNGDSRANVCQYCLEEEDPDENGIERGGDGTSLAKKLEGLANGKDPDEVGLVIEDDDLIADGCGVLNLTQSDVRLDEGLQLAEDAQDRAGAGDLKQASRLAAEASLAFEDARDTDGDLA